MSKTVLYTFLSLWGFVLRRSSWRFQDTPLFLTMLIGVTIVKRIVLKFSIMTFIGSVEQDQMEFSLWRFYLAFCGLL